MSQLGTGDGSSQRSLAKITIATHPVDLSNPLLEVV